MNAGVWNVPGVIRSVLGMVGLKAGTQPSVGLLSQMLVEMKHVSFMLLKNWTVRKAQHCTVMEHQTLEEKNPAHIR